MNTLPSLFVFIFVTLSVSVSEAIDLIHRDSLYNPTPVTRSHHLHNEFLRSISRAAHLSKRAGFISMADADIWGHPSIGEYLMSVQIGNPPVHAVGILDTGSDLTWVQCQPCINCYNQTDPPILQPNASCTYRLLSCRSKPCQALKETNGYSCKSRKTCLYTSVYADETYSHGDLALDTFRLGPTTIDNVVFGCGHDSGANFAEDISGIIGLGGGNLSLVNLVKRRFSYCLPPRPDNGKIYFGDGAHVTGRNVVWTPMVSKYPTTFYYATLEGVSVSIGNNGNLRVQGANGGEQGNMIIDSGTTLTFIPPDFHKGLVSALASAIGGKVVQDPQGVLDLCYKGLEVARVPDVTIHFAGADVVLPPANTFLEVAKDITCLTILPSDGLAVFGNLAQQGYLIGFDLGNRTISFLPADCSKFA